VAETRKPLVVVLGPTGSGKSALALDIAERFNGEIVNCDSLQFYRGFDIGTAKPTLEERRGIPHHLFDILDPPQLCTAGDYARIARRVLGEIAMRGHLPVVVGGAGFYLKALLEGLFPGPARDESVRLDLLGRESRRAGFLHRALARMDAAAAARIHPNDKNKLIRALEVCLAARSPMTRLFEQGRDPLTGFVPIKVALDPPRSDLYYKLDRRCYRMLEAGLIQEVSLLLLSGISPLSKPFESIGYKEMLAFLQGRMDLAAALELMRRDTRRYAKRQLTWFRRESHVHWMTGFGTDKGLRDSVIDMLVKYLQNLDACAG
jgi:tRNA dimethylallyltransferase